MKIGKLNFVESRLYGVRSDETKGIVSVELSPLIGTKKGRQN